MTNPLKKLGRGFDWLEKYLDSMIVDDIVRTSMQDPGKITGKIQELNGQSPQIGVSDDWFAVDGTHALTEVQGDLTKREGVRFLPATGVPVKVFINRRNGEIKLFPAMMFEQ